MKKITLQMISIIILGILFTAVAAAQKNPPNGGKNPSNNNTPAGQFIDIWVEHNVVQNGRKGMWIYSNFNVQNSLNNRCQMRAAFYYDNGTALIGSENGYKSKTGNVVAYKDFTPGYERAVYNDFQIFMPYSALNMGAGKSKLKLQLFMYDLKNNQLFAKSVFVNFTLNQG